MSLLTCTIPNNRIFNRINDLEQALGVGSNVLAASRTHQDQDNYYLQVDLPGVRREDVTLKIEADELTVTAVRNLPENGEMRSYTFNRSFVVPADVDSEKISAEQKDGVLSVTLPKKEESKPRTISINVN